jgi:hypothetical protein
MNVTQYTWPNRYKNRQDIPAYLALTIKKMNCWLILGTIYFQCLANDNSGAVSLNGTIIIHCVGGHKPSNV